MTVRIITGDCRDVLKSLPDESVHCVVTSPPYWGLRDYGVSGQIGLEGSFAGYVEIMRNVFGEVKRVLRKDGMLWLNLGDSYSNYRAGNKGSVPGQTVHNKEARGKPAYNLGGLADDDPYRIGNPRRANRQEGLKEKDLCGIPWRVAFALQADGWYLRSDIIWSKPNPMPESVTDRPTRAHEYIFLMSKSERYYYDAEAIKDQIAPSQVGRIRNDAIGGPSWKARGQHSAGGRFLSGVAESAEAQTDTRNRRTVWEIPTAPFSEAHFATFPPALIEPCIKAGCPERCCTECGAPWVRDVERLSSFPTEKRDGHPKRYGDTESKSAKGFGMPSIKASTVTLGFSPSCYCDADTVQGTVLDPFGGAGTTGLVADRLKRSAILIELNPKYAAMAERRISGDAGMFAEVAAE